MYRECHGSCSRGIITQWPKNGWNAIIAMCKSLDQFCSAWGLLSWLVCSDCVLPCWSLSWSRLPCCFVANFWDAAGGDKDKLEKLIELLRRLPVFESCGGKSGDSEFVALQSNKYLAPEGTNPALLSCDFIKPDSDSEQKLLVRHFGVTALDAIAFYRGHVFPKIGDLNPTTRDESMLRLLKDFGSISKKEPNLVELLRYFMQLLDDQIDTISNYGISHS